MLHRRPPVKFGEDRICRAPSSSAPPARPSASWAAACPRCPRRSSASRPPAARARALGRRCRPTSATWSWARCSRPASGQIPSRQVSVGIGLGPTVGSETINKVCASGMRAATLADVLIRAGEHDVIVAGGMESMSNAPYLLPKARFGYTFGDGTLVDSMTSDGLTCTFDGLIMAEQNSQVSAEIGHHPRAAGRVGAAQPRARDRGHRRRPAGRRDRARDHPRPPRRHRGRHRRGAAPRHLGRAAGGASARVLEGRRDDRRERAGRERRRGGARARVRGLGARARPRSRWP